MDVKPWQMLKLLDPELISKIKIAFIFGASGNEAIIVTKEDEVFSFGLNESGCLGFGEVQGSLSPKKIEELCNKNVKGFASGSGPFAVALTENGEVYSWGKNDVGQIGNNKSGENVLSPYLITGDLFEKKVIEIACGGSHTLALTANGEVYFWGMNYGQKTSQDGYGQVNTFSFGRSQSTTNAQSFSIPYQKTPKRVTFDTEIKVIAIACGNKTSMALLENGELYGWGYADKGQLGMGNIIDYYQPNPTWISSFKHVVIKKVVCGWAHSLAVSDIGELFTWGDNTNGQLGTGSQFPAHKPIRITSEIGRVVDIAAVHNFNLSAAMTENSEVYMWGNCRGQNITKPLKTHFASLYDVFACCASVTPAPIRVDMNPGTTVADSMRKAFNDPTTSDLKIIVEGQPLYVHKAFLKIRCEHLRTTFHERWQEPDADTCEINNFSYGVYRAFLEYLYTDEVKLPVRDALELLDLANSYCEEQLKKKCVEIIERGLTVENAAFVFGTILNYDIKKLEESCLKFCVNHMTAVIKTEAFKNLPIKTRMKFIEKAAEFGAFKA